MEKNIVMTTVLPSESVYQSDTITSNTDSNHDIPFQNPSESPEADSIQMKEISCSEISSEPLKQKRKKRDKYIPDAVPLELPPCRICGKKASGNHYGVNSCEACKVCERLSYFHYFSTCI